MNSTQYSDIGGLVVLLISAAGFAVIFFGSMMAPEPPDDSPKTPNPGPERDQRPASPSERR